MKNPGVCGENHLPRKKVLVFEGIKALRSHQQTPKVHSVKNAMKGQKIAIVIPMRKTMTIAMIVETVWNVESAPVTTRK